MKHLIFYDHECRFCQTCIEFILRRDQNKIFAFAPLSGKTAKKYAIDQKNTLVLIENYQLASSRVKRRAKAVFRIFWLLGGFHRLLGVISFLPKWLIDPFYQVFVWGLPRKHPDKKKKDSSRFLP